MNNHFDMNPESNSRPHRRGRGGRGHRRSLTSNPGFTPEGTEPEAGRGHGRGRGPRGHHPHRGHGPRRRNRGEVRIAVLLLLTEEPMHGYQLMQTISERTAGAWSPSPGAIYPTLSQLEDEGLVQVTQEAGRRLATLTETGQTHVAEHRDSWTSPLVAGSDDGVNLREALHQLAEATRTVGRTGTADQRTTAADILARARKDIYLLLAEQ